MPSEVISQPTPAQEFRSRAIIVILAVIAIVLVAAALRATYVVTMPLVYSFYLAMLVRPVQVKLNHILPYRFRWLSLVVTMLLVLLVLAIVATFIWLGVDQFRRTIARYSDRFSEQWMELVEWSEAMGVPLPADFMQSETARSILIGFGTYILTSVWSLLVLLVVILFLALLMLLEVRDWQRKIRQVLPHEDAVVFINNMNVIAERIRHYLMVQSLAGFIAACLAGIWLWVLGVDFALLWALLFFLLNYIPNVGPVLGGIPPVVVALLQFNFAYALLVIVGLTSIQQVTGNLIEPRLLGRALQVSPTFLVVSIFAWAWIWGVPGAIAAVPIMVTILVLFAHIPYLRPIALLLSRSVEKPVVETEPPGQTPP